MDVGGRQKDFISVTGRDDGTSCFSVRGFRGRPCRS